MPEVLLIELDKRDVADAALRMRRGDDPLEICGGLWEGLEGLGCLICDSEITGMPFTMIMPNRPPHHRTKMVAAPLCPTCAALPTMLRMYRGELMLRRMWTRPGGPQVHFR
jgi:hypothetical protein